MTRVYYDFLVTSTIRLHQNFWCVNSLQKVAAQLSGPYQKVTVKSWLNHIHCIPKK